ncbi:hypothetical protein J7I93_03025 [Bacillus sp. ISL-47]|uniref:hypothetical protein n=1 Tax=Bacillus sp. ISL-47 TaxID=2819130 RepID=UPI001BEBCFC8|nr:hypothetical protein [Bacillus sp. ISL-47]MBT2687151.1 hypothetical protein [Bacillus sp. ISL-47]MBT2709750.1 hypothetical protein [Pseudomonas sp. ISL-84]
MNTNLSKSVQYGFGLLSIALISRWTSGNAVFTAPEAFLRYGFIGAVSFSAAGILAFLMLIPIITRVRESAGSASFPEIMASRLSDPSLKWMKRILLLAIFFGMTVMGYAAGILVYPLGTPVPIGMSLFFLFGFLAAIFFRLKWFTRFSMLKVGILFLIMIMILVHAYMLEGIEVVYDGIRLYHPYLLYVEWDVLPSLVTAFTLAMLGHLLLDLKMWNMLLKSKKEKLRPGLITTGLIWGTIPFSFSMIALSAIYKGGFENLYAVFEKIFLRYEHFTFTVLLVFILMIIFFETFLSQVHSLYVLYNRNDRKLNKHMWGILSLFVLVIPLWVHFYSISLLNLYFISGVFFAGALPVILRILWSKQKQGRMMPAAVLISALTGWTALYTGAEYRGIIVSFMVSILILLAGWPIVKRQHKTN